MDHLVGCTFIATTYSVSRRKSGEAARHGLDRRNCGKFFLISYIDNLSINPRIVGKEPALLSGILGGDFSLMRGPDDLSIFFPTPQIDSAKSRSWSRVSIPPSKGRPTAADRNGSTLRMRVPRDRHRVLAHPWYVALQWPGIGDPVGRGARLRVKGSKLRERSDPGTFSVEGTPGRFAIPPGSHSSPGPLTRRLSLFIARM